MSIDTWTIIGTVTGIVGVIVAIYFGIKQTPEKKGSSTLRQSTPITSNIPKDSLAGDLVKKDLTRFESEQKTNQNKD